MSQEVLERLLVKAKEAPNLAAELREVASHLNAMADEIESGAIVQKSGRIRIGAEVALLKEVISRIKVWHSECVWLSSSLTPAAKNSIRVMLEDGDRP